MHTAPQQEGNCVELKHSVPTSTFLTCHRPRRQKPRVQSSPCLKAEVSYAPSPNIVVVIQRVAPSHRPRWSALAPPPAKGANDRARSVWFTPGRSRLILLESWLSWQRDTLSIVGPPGHFNLTEKVLNERTRGKNWGVKIDSEVGGGRCIAQVCLQVAPLRTKGCNVNRTHRSVKSCHRRCRAGSCNGRVSWTPHACLINTRLGAID